MMRILCLVVLVSSLVLSGQVAASSLKFVDQERQNSSFSPSFLLKEAISSEESSLVKQVADLEVQEDFFSSRTPPSETILTSWDFFTSLIERITQSLWDGVSATSEALFHDWKVQRFIVPGGALAVFAWSPTVVALPLATKAVIFPLVGSVYLCALYRSFEIMKIVVVPNNYCPKFRGAHWGSQENVLGDRDLILSQAQAYVTSLGIKLNSDAEIVQRYCIDKPYSADWTIQWAYPEMLGFWMVFFSLLAEPKKDPEHPSFYRFFNHMRDIFLGSLFNAQIILWPTFWISYGGSYPYIPEPPRILSPEEEEAERRANFERGAHPIGY